MNNPNPGVYKVTVDHYDAHGAGATTASLRVYVGEKLKYSGSYTFISYDRNATGGHGSNSASFWNACQFTIEEEKTLEISEVKTHQDSPVENAIFTTASGENEVLVRVAASDNINDEDIHYEIKEVNEGYTVATSNLTGREITFNAERNVPGSWTAAGQPLTYQITAYTLNEKGERDIVSNTVTLKQDIKSQIRQEYIDKQCLNSDFIIPIPDYDSIKDQSEFPIDSPYYFEYFSNDHFPGYTILDDSLYTALKNIKEHLGQARQFIVGAWYNPRKNDSIQKDEVNSLHQSGNAVDLAPSYCSAYWPAGVKTYKEATACLLGAVLCCIDLSKFNAYIEGNHVHLEKAIPSSWYSLELPDEMGDSPVYLSDVDMAVDGTAGEYVTVLIDDGTGARGYVLIDGEWILANEAANMQSLLRTYSVSGNYLSITKSISVKVNQKINELLVTFLNKMKINRADLDSQDINSILNGLAFSVDDNVLFGLLQKAFGKTQPIDDYYFMRGKSYTDAVFFAWFLKSSVGSAIAALDAIKNAGIAQTFALATSETVVGGVALEAVAVEEAARAAVMAGVTVGFAVMANRSKGILKVDVETLKTTIGYKIRNVGNDILDRFEGYKGGHTIEKHVSKTNEELINRAISEGVDATSYTNKSTAIKAVQQNMRRNADVIEDWLKSSSEKPLVITCKHEFDVGFGAAANTKHIVYGIKESSIYMVKYVENYLGFRIVTSYPKM
jgi:hypothetical protein